MAVETSLVDPKKKHALKLLQVLPVLNIDTLQPLLHLLTCVVQSNLGPSASLLRD